MQKDRFSQKFRAAKAKIEEKKAAVVDATEALEEAEKEKTELEGGTLSLLPS